MDSGLYIAASGMLSEMVRQEQISNQLANVNTPGFKSEGNVQEGFGELLLQNTVTGAQVGSLSLGAQISETPLDLTPNPLHETGEPLDFGIEGEGFFGVTPRRACATPATASSPPTRKASSPTPRATRCSAPTGRPSGCAPTAPSTPPSSGSSTSPGSNRRAKTFTWGTPRAPARAACGAGSSRNRASTRRG